MNFTDDYTGCFAFSLAGHDKGRLFVISAQSDDFVFLVDGDLKPLSSPKKKKMKHLQLVKQKIPESELKSNTGIKRAIKIFLKEGKEAN